MYNRFLEETKFLNFKKQVALVSSTGQGIPASKYSKSLSPYLVVFFA
jgi:hypothetical protein